MLVTSESFPGPFYEIAQKISFSIGGKKLCY